MGRLQPALVRGAVPEQAHDGRYREYVLDSHSGSPDSDHRGDACGSWNGVHEAAHAERSAGIQQHPYAECRYRYRYLNDVIICQIC